MKFHVSIPAPVSSAIGSHCCFSGVAHNQQRAPNPFTWFHIHGPGFAATKRALRASSRFIVVPGSASMPWSSPFSRPQHGGARAPRRPSSVRLPSGQVRPLFGIDANIPTCKFTAGDELPVIGEDLKSDLINAPVLCAVLCRQLACTQL